MIIATRIFIVLHLLMLTQSEYIEKIYDKYFNGYCFWSEEISYHVYHASGCKVYFTCQRGEFLNFYRCPESTIFNTDTHKCDPNGICKGFASVNPSYDAWWSKVADVMDEVLEELKKSSLMNLTETNSLSSSEVPRIELDASTVDLHPPTVPSERKINVNETESLPSKSWFDNEHKSVEDIPVSQIIPTQSIASSSEAELLSVHFIPVQYETQNSMVTNNLFSLLPPLNGDTSFQFDQLRAPFETITSHISTNQTYFTKDFLLPLFQDIVNNATVMSEINHLLDVVFKTADPLFYQIMDQKIDEDKESIKTISVKELQDAWNKTSFAASSIFEDVLFYIYPIFIKRLSNSWYIIKPYMISKNNGSGEIISPMFRFFKELIYKYGWLRKATPMDQLKTLSIIEIRNDFKYLFDFLMNIFG